MKKVFLKRGRERSVERRHPWIFSGAIDAERTGEAVLAGLGAGETVAVCSADGETRGYGWYSPASQIRVRLLSFDSAVVPDEALIRARVGAAVGRRAAFFANAETNAVRLVNAETNAVRLVNAESDGLPGVVADFYAGFVVCQFTSAGADRHRAAIAEALMTYAPFARGVAERLDVEVRAKEGLPTEPAFRTLTGEEPPELIEIAEGPCKFLVDVRKGHKTGFYLDQRDARAAVGPLANGGEVLNCFAYTGGFGLYARAGIGGVQMFDAGCDIPPGGLDFNSPEWFEMFRHAASEARRLGLEICIPNCSGWSSSGGPWNPPSNGMKRITFRQTSARGPAKFRAKLPREMDDHGFYADIGVFAFPTPPAEKASFDGVAVKVAPDAFSFSFENPFAATGFSYRLDYRAWRGDAEIAVEISEDGASFRPFEMFRVPLARSGARDNTLRFHAFPQRTTMRALRARVVRADVKATLVEARPEARMRLSNLAAKTFALRQEVPCDTTPATPDQVVATDAVRDLTNLLQTDGTLAWDVPAGDWTILRVGYVCNGRQNHPASDHGLGLEVDKLSAEALDYHFEQYVARLCRALGPLAGKVATGLNNILVDSYEVGSQNWTQKMEAEFERRRGYSLRPFMPAFAGYVLDDVATTERFLEDFRRVVADLFAENYAGALARKCHEYGLLCSVEPYGNCPADNLQYGQHCDIPMGEFWSDAGNPYGTDCGNAKFVSSVAHVWGRPYCGAEAFTAAPGARTGRWLTTPFSIKAQGDSAFASGVNRIIYHRFTHQPWADDRYLPGMTMGRWGMHLDSTQTWWEFARPWFAYQARCQYMLQAGTFCADVLFFAGEEAPNQGGNTNGGNTRPPFFDLPDGYDSDVCPTDALHRLKVEDGRVVVPGGVRYRVLALPPMEAASPDLLACVTRLRDAGATVVWPRKPVRAPGLTWGKDGDRQVRRLADALWARGVFAGVAEALAARGVAPDVTVVSNGARDVRKVAWLHRRDAEADWYFVAMPNREEATAVLSFRQAGREPELWDAETGAVATLSAAPGARVVLDLGDVRSFAEVTANGTTYPALWKPPFRVDVTDALVPDRPLALRIRVANLWANRLIGDDREHADDCMWRGSVKNGTKEIGIKEIPQWVKEGKKSPTGRCTFTTWKHWDKDDELLPSGLLGPVCLRTVVPARLTSD